GGDQIVSLRRLPRLFEEFAQLLNLLLLRFETGLQIGEVVGASCTGESQEPRPRAEQQLAPWDRSIPPHCPRTSMCRGMLGVRWGRHSCLPSRQECLPHQAGKVSLY